MMKVLNLYAGIGGNRKLWEDVEVTAVELDPAIASLYQGFFPDDEMVITDAHEFLLNNYQEYDFIWSSPPCQTHAWSNNFLNAQGCIRYPDMGLWQEIVFLKRFHRGQYVIENVLPYYEPIEPSQVAGRHHFWANFMITPFRETRGFNLTNARTSTQKTGPEHLKLLEEHHGFVYPGGVTKGVWTTCLRNCVFPPLGKHILNCARGNTQKTLTESINMEVSR